MRLHPGRILGIVMGLVILVVIFLLPFFSSQTLYARVSPLFSSLGMVQLTANAATVASDYVLLIVFILLVVAGIAGVFPSVPGFSGWSAWP